MFVDDQEKFEYGTDIENEEIDEFCASNLGRFLPSHLQCASHTLNLIASADMTKAIELHPELKIIHSKIIQKGEAIWKIFQYPKKREILIGTLKRSLRRPIITR